MKNAPNLELSLLARQWGASAVPFSELSAEAWLETPQSQRALALLEQTATLRSVMLLAGPNGVGKSALVGRWLSRLDRRLFFPLLLTHASLSASGLLSALAAKLGKPATFRREANLALIEAPLLSWTKPKAWPMAAWKKCVFCWASTWPTRRLLAWCSSVTNTSWAPCACASTAPSSPASPAIGV